MFEEVVDPAFHSGIRGLATKVFGTMSPVDILANLQRLYGKPVYQGIDAVLLRLNNPMNQIQPVEVMLRGIEELQLFLLSNTEEERELTDPNLISYALIKLTKPGECMTKA